MAFWLIAAGLLLLLLRLAFAADGITGCPDRCGDVDIPYPFGIGPNCSRGDGFDIACNTTNSTGVLVPTLAAARRHAIQVQKLTVFPRPEVKVMLPVAYTCYNSGGNVTKQFYGDVELNNEGVYRISDERNMFVVIGCNTVAWNQHGDSGGKGLYRNLYYAGCVTYCGDSRSAMDGKCAGVGCCHVDIPPELTDNVVTFEQWPRGDQGRGELGQGDCQFSRWNGEEPAKVSLLGWLGDEKRNLLGGANLDVYKADIWPLALDWSDMAMSRLVPLTLDLRLDIAIESAEGLRYMHSSISHTIRHGDVKPANILLTDKFVAKISDFGTSKLLTVDKEFTMVVAGSMGYIDPVFYMTGHLTQKSDVYSFGVVLLELISRRQTIYGKNRSLIIEFQAAYDQANSGRLLFDKDIAIEEDVLILEEIGRLAMECLNEKIDERPDMKEVVARLMMLRRSRKLRQENYNISRQQFFEENSIDELPKSFDDNSSSSSAELLSNLATKNSLTHRSTTGRD
uniref:Protein kinase domain-containing protein n=1 Tax=Oryza barthii TaxID=65489 RepID=A0A0D3HAJ3_9ORYZ